MNVTSVVGTILRLYPVLAVLLTLGAAPALAQSETEVSTYSATSSQTPHDQQSETAGLPQENEAKHAADEKTDPIVPVEATHAGADSTYSTLAADLAPVDANQDTFEIAQDSGAEAEPTRPRPVETRLLGSQVFWEIEADALFLRRTIPEVVTGIDDQLSPIDNTVLGSSVAASTGSLNFGLESGARLTAAYYPTPQTGYEISFMGLYDWSDSKTFISSGGESLRVAFIDAVRASQDDPTDQAEDFVQAAGQQLDYESNLNSLEFNYRYALTPPSEQSFATLTAGLRYMSIDEGFNLTSLDGSTRLGGNIGTYRIRTNNDLLGLQVGVDSGVQLTPSLGLGLSAKAGLMLNFNSQNSVFTNDNGLPTVLAGAGSSTSLSPVFELEGTARWDISDNFTLKTGYHLLALGGVATAPAQFGPLEELGNLERTSVLYHGPFVGFEARF